MYHDYSQPEVFFSTRLSTMPFNHIKKSTRHIESGTGGDQSTLIAGIMKEGAHRHPCLQHPASSSTMFTVPNALVKSRKILKSYALSESLRHRNKTIFHEEFDASVDGDIVIQLFCGEERQEQAEDWIKQFQKWGVKHG